MIFSTKQQHVLSIHRNSTHAWVSGVSVIVGLYCVFSSLVVQTRCGGRNILSLKEDTQQYHIWGFILTLVYIALLMCVLMSLYVFARHNKHWVWQLYTILWLIALNTAWCAIALFACANNPYSREIKSLQDVWTIVWYDDFYNPEQYLLWSGSTFLAIAARYVHVPDAIKGKTE